MSTKSGCPDCSNTSIMSNPQIQILLEGIICLQQETNARLKYANENCGNSTGGGGGGGESIMLRNNGVYIQWKYVSEPETAWKNLVAISDITGPAGKDGVDGTDGVDGQDGQDGVDGQPVVMRNNGTFIQYKYANQPDSAFINLVALSDLKGAKGDDGTDGTDGTDGVDGEDGREIIMRANGFVLQYQYVGDTAWISLIDLSTLPTGSGDDTGAYFGVQATMTRDAIHNSTGLVSTFIKTSDYVPYFAVFIPGDTESPEDMTTVIVTLDGKRYALRTLEQVMRNALVF